MEERGSSDILLDAALRDPTVQPGFRPRGMFIGPGTCSGGCVHCMQGFGDQQARRYLGYTRPEVVVRELRRAEGAGVANVVIAVGEPFVPGEWLEAVLPVIASSAILKLTTLDTSLSWVDSTGRAVEAMRLLRSHGLSPATFLLDQTDKPDPIHQALRLCISVDDFHASKVPFENVLRFVEGFVAVFPEGRLTVQVVEQERSGEDRESSRLVDALVRERLLVERPDRTTPRPLALHRRGEVFFIFRRARQIVPGSPGAERAVDPRRALDRLCEGPALRGGFVVAAGGTYFASDRLVLHHRLPIGSSFDQAVDTMRSSPVLRDLLVHGLLHFLRTAGLERYALEVAPRFDDPEGFVAHVMLEKGNEIRRAYRRGPELAGVQEAP